jgi:hypothetical protein
MKLKRFLGWSSALCLSALPLLAQETKDLQQLQEQLRQMQKNFEEQQRLQRQQIEALQKQLEEMQKKQAQTPAAPPPPPAEPAPSDLTAKPWRPTDPIRLRSGSASMDIGLVGTFAAGGSTTQDIEGGTQLGGHDPNQRGFTVQAVEANFAGAVDPYFRGLANILFQIDAGGESFLEVEEAYLESLSLPANLQVRGGQFFTEFGRHNMQHVHSWAFVDTALVNGRFLGPDALRNPGGRLSWLMPTPFYSELFFNVQDSQGETAASFRAEDEELSGLPFAFRPSGNDRGVRNFDDLLLAPRYAVSFDVTDTQTLVLGASAAFGPNARGGASAGDTDTQIYGADIYWKWRPTDHAGGFPFVSWQTELMWKRAEVGFFDGDFDGDGALSAGDLADPTGAALASVPGETLTDYGFYTQLLYGFRKGWVAGLRYDYVNGRLGNYEQLGLLVSDGAGGGAPAGRDLLRARRWRLSPNLTWYPSEFSKIRLQYNYDDRDGIDIDHSVWLQFEFVLGAHAAHKF